MRRLFYIVLLFLALPLVAQEEFCMDGTLLFREDFGGNDPSDPAVSSQNVPGMSSQYYNSGNNLGSGHYTVRKEGWSNGIQWHRQDDHTYPNDKTRGYLLEVDGIGGAEPFYSTTIDGLCAGSKLTFSAYVVNVHYAGQLDYFGGSYVYPRMKFVLKDPTTGSVLAEKSTGDIQPDWRYGTPETWKYARDNALSAEWQLIGMNFVVPEGVESIQMYIYNDVERNGSGNDFALDDIEIHLCLPKPEIIGEPEVCENYANNLSAEITNDGTMAEPLEYKWWHSMDSIAWTEMAGMTNILAFTTTQKADSGWYQVSVSGAGNIESVNCRAMSEPFRLRVNECAEELCIGGILLFREDFGGNDPSDPRVGTNPVPGMSYTQATNDVFRSMGSGKYIVTKSGYCNGDTTGWSLPGADQSTYRSQWYIQDDHTYPNDYSRGYFMEIDGSGGNQQFYQTEISGLCEGIELTFSAYVANVFTWFQYDWYTRNRGPVIAPCLKFVLTNPQTGETLAEKNTQQIPFAEDLAVKTDWQYSSPWYLVGMNFIVPTGIPAIRLTIYNNVTNGNGNDFALDDIEIRLCMTPDTIRTDTTVCDTLSQITWRGKEFALADTLRDTLFSSCGFDSIYYELHVTTDPCEEALCIDGILLFREDFGGNDPDDPEVISDADAARTAVLGMSSGYFPCLSRTSGMSSGKFLVTKQGYQNGIQWHIMDDHTYPNDKTKGYLLQIDGKGDNEPFYTTTIEGLCPGARLTFSAYVANVMTWGHYMNPNRHDIYPRVKFVLTDPSLGTELATYDIGDIPFDSAFIGDNSCWQYSAHWQLIGMNFTVPDNTNQVKLTIYNNVSSNGSGNDFALDDIEIHLCMTPDTIRTDTTVCDTLSRITWRGKEFIMADTLRDTLRSYCAFDSIYYELHVATKHCEPPCPALITVTADTLVCDTLMPYRWRDTLFTEPATYEILYKSQRGCDSLLYVLTLGTQVCCPDLITITADTMVCDTLLPFTWIIGDQTFIFERAESQEREVLHPKWKCTDTIYTLRLDTFICEKLWPIIVNKYNWQLLCDNVALRKFFPERTATAFLWYKNEQPISGATEDDYAEQNELCGVFQLNVKLDDGRSIWSNIIEIKAKDEIPIRMQIYNSQGMPVSEEQLSQGVYLYRYERGDEVWIEKKWIP